MVKAITIWQPYASLVALGIKTIETRGWSTNYRGPIAIHAAKKWDKERRADIARLQPFFNRHLKPSDFEGSARLLLLMPLVDTLGHVLAIGNLVDCVPMTKAPDKINAKIGVFGKGRFGWIIEKPVVLETPIAITGKQGLWNFENGGSE